MCSVGTLIVARDAAETLAEAMESALNESIDELVVVDDLSSDSTAEVARSFEDPRVNLVSLTEHRTLGYARGVGLGQVSSDYCFLLDADDAFLPGRIHRLVDRLKVEELDFVADEIELFDDVSGDVLRQMTIPGFLDTAPFLARLFERNYLPGIGQVGFRTEVAKNLGYDANIHGTEDSDLVLRAVLSGAKIGLVREVGYRMRHTVGSVSRNRDRQAQELAKVLRKHDYDVIEALLQQKGADERMRLWCLYRFALFRFEETRAASFLDRLKSLNFDLDLIHEPAGPFPFTERWLLEFSKGVLHLLSSEFRHAADRFNNALEIEKSPEVLNNLGVAYLGLGDREFAKASFSKALECKEGYADARENFSLNLASARVTRHLLRREPSRSDY